ncbi:MAG: hypothetical protein HKUEN07_37490 [Rhodocyclaceae bacterium]|nr:MAG: hypothetical protein HKUEN07_37490 [Rhodocyclaceae bacterium]
MADLAESPAQTGHAPTYTLAPVPRPHRKGLSIVLTLLVIALLAGGAWWLAQRGKAPAAGGGGFGPGRGGFGGGASTTVGSALALQGALPVVVDALGTVTPPQIGRANG